MGKFNPRVYSRLGQSGSVFGMELIEQADKYPLKVLSADMSVVAGLDRFKKSYPNQFYNVGIAEQNLLGVSSGLASEGFTVVSVAQACFLSMRSFEQVRQYLGYMEYPVICVGINSGFSLTFFGNTHYAVEDLALMRSVPGLTVLCPADGGSAVKAFAASLTAGKPTYIRLSGGLGVPVVYNEDFDFEIGKSICLRSGSEITIFATGTMVYNSLKAAELLTSEGISATVIDMHSIKPIDRNAVLESCGCKLLVSVEEHNVLGGLGSAISDVLSGVKSSPMLLKLGVPDRFVPVGDYGYLLQKTRLTPELIAKDIVSAFRKL